jgi:hypothetical protein
MDKLDQEIVAILKRASQARRLAEEQLRAADELEKEAKILRRAAELRPTVIYDTQEEQKGDEEISVKRGGRQPGSISKVWRGVLADIASIGAVDASTIALLAKRRGLDIQERSAAERARAYVNDGFFVSAEGGLYSVTPLAVNKFNLNVLADAENNSAPPSDGGAVNSSGVSAPDTSAGGAR